MKHDYWFRLPQLQEQQLQALTGLKTLRTLSGDSALIFDVAPGEDLASPRLSGEVKNDLAFNNAVNFFSESAAFLKAPTGTWLFVKPQLADLYVDVLHIRGAVQKPLPVYGYVLEGCKALLAIRLPDDMPSPLNELSLFRPPPISARIEGLLTPEDYRFQKSLSLSMKSDIKGAAIRYTLDDTEPTEQSPLLEAPIKLTDTATVKARLFGAGVGPGLTTWMRTFEFHPFTAVAEGLVKDAGLSFDKRVTVRFKAHAPGGTVRYTLDGGAPTTNSPAYDQPIVIEKASTLTARYFDAAGAPRGYTWSARYEEQNLALRKPVEVSGSRNPNEKPEFAVDGTVDIGQYWGTIPAPQWLQVDLEKESLIDRIHVFPYWDGQRHYQYKVEVSTDGKEWRQVVDASKNTETETEKGHLHTFPPAKARYVKITMLSNSDNPAVHLVEMKVYAAKP